MNAVVNRPIAALSDREREVLRLLLKGHDAKSAARELGLSVHTVNDHLREARRKLGVSSSREAARQLAAEEQSQPKKFAPEDFGIGNGAVPTAQRALNWIAGGMLIMSLIVASAGIAIALHASAGSSVSSVPKVVATSPKQGQIINPGRFFVSVTYDQPMEPGSMSFAGPIDRAPKVCGTPGQSPDRRTYRVCYIASPGAQYEIWFNREPYMNFKSVNGVPAEPYRLRFSVSHR